VKRSEINEIMAEADAMMRSFGFVLPPFAYWTPDEMKARRGAIDAIVSGRMGWDITDYGQGDFEAGPVPVHAEERAAFGPAGGGGMCYAEKLLISKRIRSARCIGTT
jgi:D-lyxose ketol-isomerase